MKRALIIGASGFIGTHYANKLIDQGCEVVGVDIKPPRINRDGFEFLNHDVRELSKLKLDCEVDTIFNFAAVHTTPGHPSYEYYETNVLGADEVCKFAELNDVKEIVFTSSISVYGPDEEQKDETTLLTPNSSYGYSKMLAERIHCSWYERSKERTLTVVRPAVVFGHGEGGNFTRLASLMKKGVFVYPGRKDTIKACIYVEDLINLVEQARATDNNLELLNGAYRKRYTLEDIVEEFKAEYFPNVRLFYLPKTFVLFAAKVFKAINFLNIGIHPDRVLKLIKSTNVYPQWVDNSEMEEGNLKSALKSWHKASDGKFD